MMTAKPVTPSAHDGSGLLEVDISGLVDAEVADHLLALHRLQALVDARIVAATDRFDAHAVWAADGARNAPGWISARHPLPYGSAKADVRLARDLRDMPATAAAFAAGRLTRDQARALAAARAEGIEDAFDACETVLVAEVARCTLAAGVRLLRRWEAEVRERLGAERPETEPPAEPDGSRVHLSPALEGRWVLDGSLDAEPGEIMANVLDAQIDQMWRDGVFHEADGLVLSERRAIALVEVLCRASRGGDDDGTARPLVLGIVDHRTGGCGGGGHDHVTPDEATDQPGPGPGSTERGSPHPAPEAGPVDGNAPARSGDGASRPDPAPSPSHVGGATSPEPPSRSPGDPSGAAGRAPTSGSSRPVRLVGEASRAGAVPSSTVQRWRCEGIAQEIVMGPGRDQLRMGRKTRIANRAQRRALRVRDAGCTFPGCSVAAEWCVAHHVTFFEHGGVTDLENLVLLCRFHHKAVHDRDFRMSRGDGEVTVSRPDGTPITAPLIARAALAAAGQGRPPPQARDPIDHPDLRAARRTCEDRRRLERDFELTGS